MRRPNTVTLPGADARLAFIATSTLSVGATLALGGVLGQDPGLAIGGGIAVAAAVVVLLAAGWVDGLALLVVALAAPAPYASDSFRLAPAAVITAATAFAWLLRRATEWRRLDLAGVPGRSAVALLSAVIIAAVFAEDRTAGLRETLNWILLLSLLVVAIHELQEETGRARRLALVIAATMGVAGALAALQALGVLPAQFRWGASFNRATLGFGWPNELGIFMALGVPFSVHAFGVARGRATRWLAGLGLAANLSGLAATFSRGSWVSVAAASLVLLLCGERRFVLRVALGAILAAAAIDAASGGALRSRITSTEGDWVVGQRLALTMSGLLMFRAHPILGIGPGGFGSQLDHFGAQIFRLWDYTGSAQNLYVHMAAETGILGLGALLAFLGTCLRVLLRGARGKARSAEDASLRRAVLWSFSVACTAGFFEWPFAHGVGELIVLVAGMGLALARAEAA